MVTDAMQEIRGAFSLGAPQKDVRAKEYTNLDKGFYAEAEADHVTSLRKLYDLDPMPEEVQEAKIAAAFRKYGVKDANSNRGQVVGEFAREVATLEAYLARGGIRTSGPGQSLVRDFFGTDYNVTTLFPAYMESQIIAGLLAGGLVNDLVFATEQADSRKVDALYYDDSSTDESLHATEEGAQLPELKLTTSDSTVYLSKYGGILNVTYEAMAEQRLDVLGFWLRRIGQKIAEDETDELMDVLVGGDGTTNGAAETDATDVDASVAGTYDYDDMVYWVLGVNRGYMIDTAVATATDLKGIMKLSEFKDAAMNAASDFAAPTPLDVNYLRWDAASGAASYATYLTVGVDTRYAAKKITYGGFISEADKLIERQINRRSFSYHVGWRKVDGNAVLVLDWNSAL